MCDQARWFRTEDGHVINLAVVKQFEVVDHTQVERILANAGMMGLGGVYVMATFVGPNESQYTTGNLRLSPVFEDQAEAEAWLARLLDAVGGRVAQVGGADA